MYTTASNVVEAEKLETNASARVVARRPGAPDPATPGLLDDDASKKNKLQELREKNKDKACISMVKDGKCDRKDCIFSHKAKVVNEEKTAKGAGKYDKGKGRKGKGKGDLGNGVDKSWHDWAKTQPCRRGAQCPYGDKYFFQSREAKSYGPSNQ